MKVGVEDATAMPTALKTKSATREDGKEGKAEQKRARRKDARM